MNTNLKDIDLEKLKKDLKKFRQQIDWNRPILYDALKPHVKAKYDQAFDNYYKLNILPFYEFYFTNESIKEIAHSKNHKLTYEIYNLLIVDKYRKMFLVEFPKNHPATISTKILGFTTIGVFIVSIILCLYLYFFAQAGKIIFLGGFLGGFGFGILFGTIFQKIFLYSRLRKFYLNKTYF